MSILDLASSYGLPFLIALTVLIFFHELGHYWVARLNGVRVEVFSIGFGTEIYGWTDAAGTRWKISAVPLGGYVKMFGEAELEADGEEKPPMTPEEEAVSFTHKSLMQRAAIVVAGPAANFILAIVFYAFVAAAVGVPRAYYAGVGQIEPGSPAAAADFRPGDRILSVDERPVTWFSDLIEAVSARPEEPITVLVRRDSTEIPIRVTPRRVTRTDADGNRVDIGQLGIRPDPRQADFERQGPIAAVWIGVEQTVGLTGNILDYLGELVAGRGNKEDVGGVLRIAQFSGKTFESGMDSFILFLAALSVNLGLINLFPIPLLDGGHLMFLVAEAVRGRPLGPRVQEYGFRFGLILVLILMVFVTWNDLVHLRVIEYIKELAT
ncbi:MAG: RIP metalloprotease RseP [Rhodospirillales bacterium]